MSWFTCKLPDEATTCTYQAVCCGSVSHPQLLLVLLADVGDQPTQAAKAPFRTHGGDWDVKKRVGNVHAHTGRSTRGLPEYCGSCLTQLLTVSVRLH
jgi:hypothetical protein